MRKEVGELTGDLEHITRVIEHHKRTSSGEILKPDATMEFSRLKRNAAGSTNLDAVGVLSAAGYEDLRDGGTKRELINSSSRTVPAYADEFCAA